ncbi:MAG: leucine-rich repeat domain-containing protein, partial [Clostridia bacterium]|nr:leucine-rich repeat domain-containing protein [Clostridia bacterium]
FMNQDIITYSGFDGDQERYVRASVDSGSDFSFQISVYEAYNESIVTVKANDTIINAVDGIYTIYSINENQSINIEGLELNDYQTGLAEMWVQTNDLFNILWYDMYNATAKIAKPEHNIDSSVVNMFGISCSVDLNDLIFALECDINEVGNVIAYLDALYSGANYLQYQNTNIIIVNALSVIDIVSGNATLVNDAYYTLDFSKLIRYIGTEANYTVPSVGIIGDGAFAMNKTIINITMPDSVIEIGSAAFNECSNLESIRLSESLTKIPDFLMHECTSVDNVILPENILSIGDSAFKNCESLSSIYIPENIYQINDYAFYDCTNLSSINLPAELVSLGIGAFSHCVNLVSVNIPLGITTIEKEAFRQCESLTGIILPDNLISIGERAFDHCTNLQAITIPDSVVYIGKYAFAYCNNLQAINLTAGIDSIEAYAFTYCTSLQALNIPSTVEAIGD